MAIVADAVILIPGYVRFSDNCNSFRDTGILAKPGLIVYGKFDECWVLVDGLCPFNRVKGQDSEPIPIRVLHAEGILGGFALLWIILPLSNNTLLAFCFAYEKF